MPPPGLTPTFFFSVYIGFALLLQNSVNFPSELIIHHPTPIFPQALFHPRSKASALHPPPYLHSSGPLVPVVFTPVDPFRCRYLGPSNVRYPITYPPRVSVVGSRYLLHPLCICSHLYLYSSPTSEHRSNKSPKAKRGPKKRDQGEAERGEKEEEQARASQWRRAGSSISVSFVIVKLPEGRTAPRSAVSQNWIQVRPAQNRRLRRQ